MMTQKEKKEFYRELLSFTIPIGLQNLLIALIGATDALMLGRLTQEAVAAVSLANQIAFIMSLFSGAVVGGGGVLIAQYWGKEDKRMVKNLFCTIIKYITVISFIFFLLAFCIPEHLMRIYTPERELIEIGASYLKIVSFSYLFNGLTQCYYLMMKIAGRATKSVIISVVTLAADMILDFFLIYGIAGVPALGADGSAYSTITVEVIALIWCIVESYRAGNIHPDRGGMMWFSPEMTKDLLKVSWPMLTGGLVWGLGFSARSLITGHLGTDAAVAASIASVAQELITCVGKGVSAGTGIMIGKLLGQNLFDKARSYGSEFWCVAFLLVAVNIGLMGVMGPIVVTFFVLSDVAKYYLVCMLVFNIVYLFAYSFNVVIVCGVFLAGGDSKYDMISVTCSMWGVALPLALLGTFVFKWPVMVVYILMCVDEIIKLPFIYPRYKKYLWLKNLTREE